MGSNRLRPHLARGRERRELIGAAQSFTKGFDPMFFECVLKLANERSFDSQLDVVPMFFVLRMPGPLHSEAYSAGETEFAVDHEDAAMRSAIAAINPPGKHRMIVGKLAACFLNHADVGIVQLPTG